MDLSSYSKALDVGIQTAAITENASDALSAGGYAALVQGITGSLPQVVESPSGHAKVLLTQEQAATMRKWIESQVSARLAKQAVSKVHYELGAVFTPLAIKYSLPAILLMFGAGFLTAKVLFK